MRTLAALLVLLAFPIPLSGQPTLDSITTASPDSGVVRVCAGGDVTVGTNLDTLWAKRASRRMGRPVALYPSPDSLLRPLRPLFEGADIVLLNIEGAIGSGKVKRPKCGPRSTACFAFRMPDATAPALRRVAPWAEVVGNVANNHANDAGAAGLRRTRELLIDARVHVTGADSLPTLVANTSGDTVAILGFGTSGFPDARDLESVRRYVSRAAERYRRIIVTMHLGTEGPGAQRTGDSTEYLFTADRGNPVAFARSAVESGASLVIGHGPHVIRAFEWKGSALVAYSLGNLLTYGPFSMREPNNRGGVLCASLDSLGHVSDVVLKPTVQRPPGLVSLDRSRRSVTLADSLSVIDFGANAAEFRMDGTVIQPVRDTSSSLRMTTQPWRDSVPVYPSSRDTTANTPSASDSTRRPR